VRPDRPEHAVTELRLDPDGLPLGEYPYPARDVRIVTHDLSWPANPHDWDTAAEAIRDLGPAVVALRWAADRDRTQALADFAEHTGLTRTPSLDIRSDRFRAGSVGGVVLYDDRVLNLERHDGDLAPHVFREFPLNLSQFNTRTPGLLFSVAHVHLGTDPRTRETQARWIAGCLDGVDTVLVGDLHMIGAQAPEPDHTHLPTSWHADQRTVRADLVRYGEDVFGPVDRAAINVLHGCGFREPEVVAGVEPATPRPHRAFDGLVEVDFVQCLVGPFITPHVLRVGAAPPCGPEPDGGGPYFVDLAHPQARHGTR